MAPLVLEGETLGTKHKSYNRLVNDAIANGSTEELNPTDNDIDNLLKIDVACHNKDVDYILNVLKSQDMLYVSRAIKKSTWLITDDNYSNIINPNYLKTQLFPEMTAKARLKLIKHIRHNLKTESRVEDFYNNETDTKRAAAWLPNCSVTFIENNILKHVCNVKISLFKRICEKSITILEKAMQEYQSMQNLQACIFFLNVDVDKYLDVVEKLPSYYQINFNARATNLVMKLSPKRIIEKFEFYIKYVHLPTFAKYIKKEEIVPFLYKQAEKDSSQNIHLQRFFINFCKIDYFIRRIPKQDRFDFVKKVFIDKIHEKDAEESAKPGTEMYHMKKLCNLVRESHFRWYEFAPFEIAFDEIKKLIPGSFMNVKHEMLETLIVCAGNNMRHLQALLKYYQDKHLNDEADLKLNFLNNLVSKTNVHEYDEDVWTIFTEIIKSIDNYIENGNVQNILEIVIIYNVIRHNEIPEIVKDNFKFNTLINYKSKFNDEQKNHIFSFLYNQLLTKVENNPVAQEKEFSEHIQLLKDILSLLLDWDKDLQDYPLVLEKIRESIKIRKENSWKESLVCLYNVKKSWRKYMFEESVILHPSADVCINALKHDPQLLVRYVNEVDAMRSDDAMSLSSVLKKIRIYWPHSLLSDWTNAYLGRLDNLGGHKSLIRGLFTTLPQERVFNLITKYAPKESKINWDEINEVTLSLQRQIATNMHIARPQPSPEALIYYAKGDYLKYTLPSLLSIFYNLSAAHTRNHIHLLLNAPVSLQKHGLRFAYIKLNPEELKVAFSDIWKTSKNATIRAVIFKFTHDLLCKETDSNKAQEMWELLEVFIDNLSFTEDKKIYAILPEVEKIPINVRSKYLPKSYKFLKSLVPHVKDNHERSSYEWNINKLAEYTRDIMESMCPNFITDIITEFIDKQFFNNDMENNRALSCSSGLIPVISAYILCGETEEIQTQRYESIIVPLWKRSLTMWGEIRKGSFIIRKNVYALLERFTRDLQYIIKKNMKVPLALYMRIQNEIESSLSVTENYIILTMFKLTASFAKIISDTSIEENISWDDLCREICPQFGKQCLEYLKQDVKQLFPNIHFLFEKALKNYLNDFIPDDSHVIIFDALLADKDFIEAYLVVINIYQKYRYNNIEEPCSGKEIVNTLLTHASTEVKMNYYHIFKDKEDM